MIDADGKKICPRCREAKVAEGNFYRVKQGDGFAGYCIPCMKAKAVEWQKANHEKKRATDARMYRKHPHRREQLKRFRKRFAEENPGADKAIIARWRKANPEKVKAIVARHHAKNPEARKTAQAKYHASDRFKGIHADRERLRRAVVREVAYADGRVERSIDGEFTIVEWQAVLAAFNGKCAYCDADGRMTIEHLTPLSRQGTNQVGNIAPACHPCNSRKSDQTAEEFAPLRAADIRARAMLN